MADWKIHPHDEIEKHEDNLWSVEGDLPHQALRRRMTVVKLESGGLLIHSCMALEAEAMGAIEAWGKPAVLLVPSAWHRMDAPAYKERYPGLKIYCPSGADKHVRKVTPPDGHYEDIEPDATCRVEYLEGVGRAEGVLTVRSQGGYRTSLVVCDAIFNIGEVRGLAGLIPRLLGSSGGPKVTRIMKLFGVKDKGALRSHFERLASIEGLHRIIMAHGAIIEDDAPAVLRKIAAEI